MAALSMLDVFGWSASVFKVLSPPTAQAVSHSSRPPFRDPKQPLGRSKHSYAVFVKLPAGGLHS